MDALLVLCVLEVCSAALATLDYASAPLQRAILLVFGFLGQWAYGTVFEWRFGGTLGKRAFGIVVVDELGRRPTFRRAALRNLLRVLDILPGLWLVGGVSAWIDPAGRRLGDLVAGTAVVHSQAQSQAMTPEVSFALRRSYDSHGSQPARESFSVVLSRLTRTERHAVISLAEAREGLSLGVRATLCHTLATHIAPAHPQAAHRTWETLIVKAACELTMPSTDARREWAGKLRKRGPQES